MSATADYTDVPFLLEGRTDTAGNREEYDIVVVGAGTGGSFAGAAAAAEGADVAVLDRKSPAQIGDIACGDALHDPLHVPGPVDGSRIVDEAIERYGAQHNYISKGIWQDVERGHQFEIPFGDRPEDRGNIVHRHAYGQVIADEAVAAGADLYADTVVQDVERNGTWTVTAAQEREPVRFEADLLIDAAGARSIVQDYLDQNGYFEDATFQRSRYDQEAAAYREIVRTQDPVPYADEEEGALLIGPTEELGYFWVFTYTPHIHNVGLGFQMSEDPMQMVQAQREEMRKRPEFDGAAVLDKLGSTVTTRRPLDSAVAPAYMAVGGAACTTSATTGKGMEPAMKGGAAAGRIGAEAVADGDLSEAALFPFWKEVMDDFGARYAAQDVWNVAGMAYDVDTLRGVVATAPREYLMAAVTAESGDPSMLDAARAAGTYVGRNLRYALVRDDGVVNRDQLDALRAGVELREVGAVAEAMREHYDAFPADPDGFDDWQAARTEIDREMYAVTGAEQKYPLFD
ncbi:MAG: FAD-dependent oxidoreductase [Candidatus Nanohaloarchaea archaeon]|nr:FAD-dependent oxidoreductase [Candidatus Nanohaloarchaea archaeon]